MNVHQSLAAQWRHDHPDIRGFRLDCDKLPVGFSVRRTPTPYGFHFDIPDNRGALVDFHKTHVLDALSAAPLY